MGNEMSSHKEKGQKGKVHNGDLNGHAVNVSSNDLTEAVTNEVTVEETSQSSTLAATTDADSSPAVEDTSVNQANGEVQEQSNEISSDKAAAEQTNNAVCITLEGEESKSSGGNKTNFFGKLFKKKSDTEPVEVIVETKSEVNSADQVDAEVEAKNLQAEPVDIKDSTELEQSEGESLHSSPAVTEQNQLEENPVMNFFKTLVTPTKTPKEATASSDVSKDQSQKDIAATTAPANAQEVDAKGKMAQSPPSEPLKMEGKGEPTVKKVESQDAPKETQAGAKPKAAKESPFSKLFRSKTVEETAEPVEVETDASKAATLEASAKAEPAPAAKEEEKKPEKSSPFASLFKPKAAEPPKDTPVVAASPEPAQAAKAKEEVKAAPPSAPPAPPAPPVDKAVENAENASPTVPRKEKRNSIQLFFKNLGQKRHSDAGVQTESAAASPAEKGK